MARAHFSETAIDPQGNAIEAIVTVTLRGSSALADIYASETATFPMENPYFIGSGIVSHWADAGAFDVTISDADNPPRVEDRIIGWSAVPGVPGGIPGGLLEDDAVTSRVVSEQAIDLINLAVAVRQQLVPVGTLMSFAGVAAPAGFLLADGTDYAQIDYPALFTAIGSAFNTASGRSAPAAGRFRVPDLRGRAPIGVGTGVGLSARVLAASGGAETHPLTAAESGVPAHTHNGSTASFPTSAIGESAGMYHRWGAGDIGRGDNSQSAGAYTIYPSIPNNTAQNAVNAHNNMQPYLALNHIIKV
jgi:microcystin-dependent protein